MNDQRISSSTAFLVLILVAGLIIGGLASTYIFLRRINSLEDDISSLRDQVSKLSGFQNVTYQNITVNQNSTVLTQLYESVKDSVVLIRGWTGSKTVQGSGFVYNFNDSKVIITNNHVVHGTTSLSVTFSDGDGYAATIEGTDPYADLAVLSVVDAPDTEYKPIEITSSSTLRVGDPVIAIGHPYGLVGTMTTGVISAVGRTISEDQYTGGFAIANIIQISAPINPGNSGGPLLNFDGKVIGITTAIVADSQGLGFAVPSNTILREVFALVEYGAYRGHSYLGLNGTDMDFETAQAEQLNVTYGWWIKGIMANGPASKAGVQVDDVMIGINGTRISNGDEMASYLEEKTLPKETVILNIVRKNQTTGTNESLEIRLVLGKRPLAPT